LISLQWYAKDGAAAQAMHHSQHKWIRPCSSFFQNQMQLLENLTNTVANL
jgi:hypothetical protein